MFFSTKVFVLEFHGKIIFAGSNKSLSKLNTIDLSLVHFIIAGDTNDLKLDQILSLDKRFVQVVQDWTRMNPPAILDPIIMTLSNFYQKPVCLDPLDSDPEKNWAKSDHKIVVAKPITSINNRTTRSTREVSVRPLPQSGFNKLKEWFIDQK